MNIVKSLIELRNSITDQYYIEDPVISITVKEKVWIELAKEAHEMIRYDPMPPTFPKSIKIYGMEIKKQKDL